MTRDELHAVLREHGIRDSAISLYGGHRDNTLAIDERGQKWVVYYTERGEEMGLRTFNDEDDACRDLLSRALSDDWYREDYGRPTAAP